jgi:O-acetyl-ADP-ribose deacetylase (regulator of RNase III)
MITNTVGNLLDANAEAVVNTVNCVGVMGKGIALQFAKRFPEILKPYKEACENKTLRPGVIQVHERRDLLFPRYILNFPTKRHWKDQSYLEDIDCGLDDLIRVVRVRGIRSLAIPALGCGHGGLDWEIVSNLIHQKLTLLVDVDIWLHGPSDARDFGRSTRKTT